MFDIRNFYFSISVLRQIAEESFSVVFRVAHLAVFEHETVSVGRHPQLILTGFCRQAVFILEKVSRHGSYSCPSYYHVLNKNIEMVLELAPGFCQNVFLPKIFVNKVGSPVLEIKINGP